MRVTCIKEALAISIIIAMFCDPAGASGISATGWTIFRKTQSVRPKSISATYHEPGDVSGMLYNPALLAYVEGKEISIDAGMGFADEQIAGVLYASKINEGLSIGGGLFLYDYGKMTLNWIEGNEIRESTVSAQRDYLGMISLGKRLNAKLNAGVSLKVASSRIAEQATASAAALDGSVNYTLSRYLLLSCAAQNIGASTKFINVSESLPSSLMMGLSYCSGDGRKYYLVGVEAPYVLQEAQFKPSLGVEIGSWPLSFFVGYRTYVNDASFSLGLGIAIKHYDLRYSYTPARALWDMHRIALGIRLNPAPDMLTTDGDSD